MFGTLLVRGCMIDFLWSFYMLVCMITQNSPLFEVRDILMNVGHLSVKYDTNGYLVLVRNTINEN